MIASCPRELIGSCLEAKSLIGSSPVPGGSPLLSQTASMCDCVNDAYLNKTILKTLCCWGWLEYGKRVVLCACCTRVSPRI